MIQNSVAMVHNFQVLQLSTIDLALSVFPRPSILSLESVFGNRICVMPIVLTMHPWRNSKSLFLGEDRCSIPEIFYTC